MLKTCNLILVLLILMSFFGFVSANGICLGEWDEELQKNPQLGLTSDEPCPITSCYDLYYMKYHLNPENIDYEEDFDTFYVGYFELANDINCAETLEWVDQQYDFCTNAAYSDQESCEGNESTWNIDYQSYCGDVNGENLSYHLDPFYSYDNETTCTDDGGTWYPPELNGFEPVGNAAEPFVANFDGNGYSISDLSINRPDEDYIGLFGYVGTNGRIVDVNLVDVNIFGNVRVGGIAGRLVGDINDSIVSGEIQGSSYVGGIAGGALGDIYDSNSDVNVTGLYKIVGGLVGGSAGTISNCHSSGIVLQTEWDSSSEFSVGGLAGVINSIGSVKDSSSSADVNGLFAVGGLVGSSMGPIINSFATGKIFVDDSYGGGLVGSQSSDINDSYATGLVIGANDVGGLVGVADEANIYNSYATGEVIGYSNAGGLVGATTGIVSNSYATGNVTQSNSGYGYKLGGLIGATTDLVENSYATGNVTGYYYLGGLIGYVNGTDQYDDAGATITKSYATGTVTENDSDSYYIGGLIGATNQATITESYSNNPFVVGDNYIGGLIGFVDESLISDVFSWSDVNSTGDYAGGLIGRVDTPTPESVMRAYSTGTVLAQSNMGGLIGYVQGDDISNSFSTSLVTGLPEASNYAGLIGVFSNNTDVYLINSYWNKVLSYSDWDENFNCYLVEPSGYEEYTYGDTNCTAIENEVSYFYNSQNAPMTEWDFNNIWLEQDNNYPVLRFAPIEYTNDDENQDTDSRGHGSSKDKDKDGVSDSRDTLLYTEEKVITNGINDLNILVGEKPTTENPVGVQEVVVKEGTTPVLEFMFDFDKDVLDLSKVTIEKNEDGIIVNLSGQLQEGQKKTIYLENNSFVSLCVKDALVTSIGEISANCNGVGEYDFTPCLKGSYSQAGINCSITSGIIKVENLTHSGVLGVPGKEDTNTQTIQPPCQENWVCSDWSECKSGQTTRNCTEVNTCGTISKKPIDTNACSVIVSENKPSPVEDQKEMTPNNDWIFILGGGLILLIIIVLAVFILVKKKK
jgi:hypothetical protein